jgi:CelD/BcsL family acetyltransferase involved in cellulose biosynthesis
MTAHTFEIVTDNDKLFALRDEWDALWARAFEPRFTQSFNWCLVGWQTTGEPRGRRLRIVVMRENGRPVLIWPMVLRRRLAWRIAAVLGAESTEYDPVLVENRADAVSCIEAAWHFVRGHCGADVVTIPFVHLGGAMHRALSSDVTPRSSHTLSAPFIAWGEVSWDDWWHARGANLRNGLNRRRRRFGELGHVTMDMVEDSTEFVETLDWTLRHKIDWMARNECDNDYLASPEYREFLVAVFGKPSRTGRLAMFVLRLDGRPIATKVVTTDGTRCEGFIAVYDSAFATYSPGQIILSYCLQWCHERGLTYDFRIGDEAYKRDWASGDCSATTWHLANTRWGYALLAVDELLQKLRETKDRVRVRIPVHWRRRIKAVIGGPLVIERRLRARE